jgi:hypothetical protein
MGKKFDALAAAVQAEAERLFDLAENDPTILGGMREGLALRLCDILRSNARGEGESE